MSTPVLKTLADLVRINSVNPNYGGPGEGEIADWILRYFRDSGVEVWADEVVPGRPNILARLPGKEPTRRVILEVHTDTVSAEKMDIPPFEPRVEGNLLYGRGACDDKGGLAAMMEAVRSLAADGIVPPCEVLLAMTVDEEFTHRGVTRLVETLPGGPRAVAAIAAEPTEMKIARANKGVVRWRIVTKGKSAHSAKPHLGVNAISAMANVIRALEAAFPFSSCPPHPLVGAATCNIGLIEGGTAINFVPDQCTIAIDRRMLPGERAADVLAACQAFLDELDPALRVEMEPPYLTDEAMETPENDAVVQVAAAVAKSLGLDSIPCGVPYGCDATKLSRAGIPSLIYGPGSIDLAHGAVEYVEMDQVEQAADFYRRFLLEYA